MALSIEPGKKPVAGSLAKTLLKNVIRHTDTHNRLLEEAEMWNIHTKMKQGLSSNKEEGEKSIGSQADGGSSEKTGHREQFDVKKSFLYDNRENTHDWSSVIKRGERKAHMDDEDVNAKDSKNKSTFWLRQMYKTEAGDDDRWGHTGYKELYPQDFDSGRSENDTESVTDSSSSRSSSSSGSSEVRRKKSPSRERHRKSKRRKEKKRRDWEKRRRKKKKKKKVDDRYDSDEYYSKGSRSKGERKQKRGLSDSKRKRGNHSSDYEDSSDDHKRKRRRK